MTEELKNFIEDSCKILKFEDGSFYQCIANKNHLVAKLTNHGLTYPNNISIMQIPDDLKEMSYEMVSCKDVIEVFGYNTPGLRSLVSLDDSVDWGSMNRKMYEFSKTLVNMHKTF